MLAWMVLICSTERDELILLRMNHFVLCFQRKTQPAPMAESRHVSSEGLGSSSDCHEVPKWSADKKTTSGLSFCLGLWSKGNALLGFSSERA